MHPARLWCAQCSAEDSPRQSEEEFSEQVRRTPSLLRLTQKAQVSQSLPKLRRVFWASPVQLVFIRALL
jgi:hypothetical protein